MNLVEVYCQPQLTDPYDLGPFRRDLRAGVNSESLRPNGLFSTNNDQIYWCHRLLGYGYPTHFIDASERDLLVQDMTKTYHKITRIPLCDLRHVFLREHCYVGGLGFLLYEDQDMFDELHIARLPEAEGSDWWNQSVQVRVDPMHRFQWVDLLAFGMYGLQEKEGENNFVVISNEHQILPRSLKIIQVAAHNFLS